MHSVHYNYAPKLFSGVWPKNDTRNINQQLCNSDQYTIPRPNTSSFTRFPLTSLPIAWNNAGNFKYHSNRTTFKIFLKNELLQIFEDNTLHLANIDMNLYFKNDAGFVWTTQFTLTTWITYVTIVISITFTWKIIRTTQFTLTTSIT